MLESCSHSQLAQVTNFEPKDTLSSSKFIVQLASEPAANTNQSNPPKNKSRPSKGAEIEGTSSKNVKKRKRDTSLPPEPEKRSGHSTGLSTEIACLSANDEGRPSPAPRNSRSTPVQTERVNRNIAIPRQCAVATVPDFSGFWSSYDIVRNNLNNFKTYFLNPRDPCDQSFTPEYLPSVELEYPMTGMQERYALLAPKDDEGWHPIEELMDAISVIVAYYLPTEHSMLLGDPSYCTYPRVRHRKRSRKFALPTPANTPRRGESPPPTSRPVKMESPLLKNLLVRMERAYISKDGIAFIATINDINVKLHTLKKKSLDGNLIMRGVSSWQGVPPQVVAHIYEETYQRSAGPRVKELVSYKAFSSDTYGELNTGLISEMCHRAGLKPGVNFLDLGSGIGNVVIQAALLSGCNGSGVEKLDKTANIADQVHEAFKQRCKMWGVESGPTDTFQGDFTDPSEKLRKLISNADVILANNFVFSPQLNEALKQVFLDLEDGTKIISLRSFADGQVKNRNAGAIENILDVKRFQWQSGDVSWGDGTGNYYISTVNRAKLKAYYEALYEEAQGSQRPSRRRR